MHKDKVVNILNRILEWSLYILVFTIPFSKTIIEICITVAFFAWIFKKFLTKDFNLKNTPLNILLLLFLVANVISFINADFRLLFARSIISKCLKFIILYFIVVETVDSMTKLKNLLKMALISAAVVMVDCYLQKFLLHADVFRLYPSFKYAPLTDLSGHTGFPTGPFPFPNDLAAWMLLIIFPALCIFIFDLKNIKGKFMLGAFFLPFIFLFYLTNTRSAWIGFFVSFFSIFLIQGKKLLVIALVIILSLILVFVLLLPREKTADIFGQTSAQDRLYMWRIGWKIFMEHPVVGNGLNMFFSKFKEEREDSSKGLHGSYAHNGFLQMAADIGIIGLFTFLCLLVIASREAIKRAINNKDKFKQALGIGILCGLWAFLIHSFFDTNLQSLPLATLFWFSLGLLMSLPYIDEKRV